MAYRKTSYVVNLLAAKRADIIVATQQVIACDGAGFSVKAVADVANVAVGTLYNHFPDQREMLAAAVADWLKRDLFAMGDAAVGLRPRPALAAAIAVYFHRISVAPRLAATITTQPAYRAGIIRRLEHLLLAARVLDRHMAAVAIYGALVSVSLSWPRGGRGQNNAPAVISMALRMAGIEPAVARELASEAGAGRLVVA